MPAETPPIPAPRLVNCWRCGKQAPADALACPSCQARLSNVGGPPRKSPSPLKDLPRPLAVMFQVVGGQLGVGVCFHLIGSLMKDRDELSGLSLVLAAEAINTLIVVIGLWALSRDASVSALTIRPRRWVWLWSWPVLALLLGVNYGYHALLRDIIQFPPHLLVTVPHDQYRCWWIAAICVQPALVEEFCFRGIALRCLTPFMNIWAAVLIASAAFALAHLGAFLGMPYLFLLGLFLGVARVRSGGLLLPMLLHAAHNACVLGLEWKS